jgi:hypothetical protein
MEIIIRDYRPGDAAQAKSVIRDANDSLRKSHGGMHPDESVDWMIQDSNRRSMSMRRGSKSKLVVAEVKGTGEIIGTGAIIRSRFDWLIGSAYSTAHYVRQDFQRGKAGVSVGSLLRKETLARARDQGCRKVYGFSNPEAVGFHKKFGARFFPNHDRSHLVPPVRLCYYEIELKPSGWNALKLEPHTFALDDTIALSRTLTAMLASTAGAILTWKEVPLWFDVWKTLAFELLGIKSGDKTQAKNNGTG